MPYTPQEDRGRETGHEHEAHEPVVRGSRQDRLENAGAGLILSQRRSTVITQLIRQDVTEEVNILNRSESQRNKQDRGR